MKNTIQSILLATAVLYSCTQASTQSEQGTPSSEATKEDTQPSSATAIINTYLALKDALVEDNSGKAAEAGSEMVKAFEEFDTSGVPADKTSQVNDILENAKEQAEHISKNGSNIAHQREHLAVLSNDLNDLINIIGTDRPLYQAFCPMYDNNKGAIWLSASSEIKNPFFGSEMLTCGKVQKEIAVK